MTTIVVGTEQQQQQNSYNIKDCSRLWKQIDSKSAVFIAVLLSHALWMCVYALHNLVKFVCDRSCRTAPRPVPWYIMLTTLGHKFALWQFRSQIMTNVLLNSLCERDFCCGKKGEKIWYSHLGINVESTVTFKCSPRVLSDGQSEFWQKSSRSKWHGKNRLIVLRDTWLMFFRRQTVFKIAVLCFRGLTV